MSIILDLIVIAIIALFSFLSAKKGFVRTLVEVAGFVLAAVLAFSLSTPISTSISENTVMPIIEEATVSALENVSTDNISQATDNVWDQLPSFVLSAAESSGITKDSISDHLSASSEKTIEGLSTELSNRVFLPIVSNVIKTVVTVILFVVLLVLSIFLARIINRLFSGVILGKLNKTLGGILGAIKGAAIASIFCLAVSLIADLTKGDFLSITTETIDSTYIVSTILNLLS